MSAEESANKTWTDIAKMWLINQSVPTVLLVLMLVGGFYAANTLVPLHLKSINDGYESINKRNAESVEKLAASHEKAVDRIASILERQSGS